MYDDNYLPRPDVKTAVQVDNGILIQQASGTLIAADYLYRKGVPMNVALRVLAYPWRRRGGPRALANGQAPDQAATQ